MWYRLREKKEAFCVLTSSVVQAQLQSWFGRTRRSHPAQVEAYNWTESSRCCSRCLHPCLEAALNEWTFHNPIDFVVA